MNEQAHALRGPGRCSRRKIVAALREQGLLRGEEPYTHTVPFSHCSGERIEPLISLQWFMNMNESAAGERWTSQEEERSSSSNNCCAGCRARRMEQVGVL